LPENASFNNGILNGYDQFNWQGTKEKVAQLPDIKDKIIYLCDISACCEQYILDENINTIEKNDHRNFIEKCRIEQRRLESNHKTISSHIEPVANGPIKFQLPQTNGFKIDFIRVINAMYELRFFRDDKDLLPLKVVVMKAFGKLVGIDLSKYDRDLSQAFSSTNPESNIAIFQRMADATQQQVFNKDDTKK
jgi:hypothetical protein